MNHQKCFCNFGTPYPQDVCVLGQERCESCHKDYKINKGVCVSSQNFEMLNSVVGNTTGEGLDYKAVTVDPTGITEAN